MEECYALLGIAPAAATEEIEAAYRNKKLEYAPDRFKEGSEEWLNASSMQKELDKAYNDAIMATFAPIKAFSAPSAPVPPPAPSSPLSPSPEMAPIRSSYAKPPGDAYAIPESLSKEFSRLVEEVPVSFSDEELLNMNIGDLRESYAPPPPQRSALFTWGIEDRLLRHYVQFYVGCAFFELVAGLAMGGLTSFDLSRVAGGYSALVNDTLPAAGVAVAAAPPSSALVSAIKALVSTACYFLCSLPMPIITRFFFLGQPAEKGMMNWGLNFLGIIAALVLYSLIGWILPRSWAGNSVSLAFVALALCAMTVKYEGN